MCKYYNIPTTERMMKIMLNVNCRMSMSQNQYEVSDLTNKG